MRALLPGLAVLSLGGMAVLALAASQRVSGVSPSVPDRIKAGLAARNVFVEDEPAPPIPVVSGERAIAVTEAVTPVCSRARETSAYLVSSPTGLRWLVVQKHVCLINNGFGPDALDANMATLVSAKTGHWLEAVGFP
jgi:hypothetical protein